MVVLILMIGSADGSCLSGLRSKLLTVLVHNIKTTLKSVDKSLVFAAGVFQSITEYRADIRHHIVCVGNRAQTDAVGVLGSRIKDLLGLLVGCIDRIICLGVSFLHDLMLGYQLLGSCLRICDDSVRLGLCILKNGVLVADDLLITLDLIRRLQTEFS